MEGLKLIAAISVDGAIGHDDDLLWHIPEDLKKYKEKTMGNLLIVGINTFLSMPAEAFRGRYAIIICGEDMQVDQLSGGKTIFPVKTPDEALELVKEKKQEDQEVYVIGGSMVYESMINEVEEAEITWVNKMYPEANKRFPIDKIFKNFNLYSEDAEWRFNEELMYKFSNYKKM